MEKSINLLMSRPGLATFVLITIGVFLVDNVPSILGLPLCAMALIYALAAVWKLRELSEPAK